MKKIIITILTLFILGCTSINYENLDFSCTQDSDCVIGYSGSGCCNCPNVYSKKDIDKYGQLRYEGESSGFFNTLNYKLSCKNVMCKPCMDIEQAVCVENQCKPYGLGIVWD